MALNYGYIDNTAWRKVYIDNTRINYIYIDAAHVYQREVGSDHGIQLNTVTYYLGNDYHNPWGGGTNSAWTIQFAIYWNGTSGRILSSHETYGRWFQLWINNNGTINMQYKRSDLSINYNVNSSVALDNGRINYIAWNYNGRFYINGKDATNGMGGGLGIPGPLIMGSSTCTSTLFNLNCWNWTLANNDMINITTQGYSYESDDNTCFAQSLDNNLNFRRNVNGCSLRNVSGSQTYNWYRWDYERVTF